MKRIITTVVCIIMLVALAGCAGWRVRTSSSREPRVDQEVSGNRGFIFGRPSLLPPKPAFSDRKVYRIEIEMPEIIRRRKSKTGDKPKGSGQISQSKQSSPGQGNWGNRGYIFDARTKIETSAVELEKKARQDIQGEKRLSPLPELEQPPKLAQESQSYKVKEGDTLQKISRKFYGTTKKWSVLYNANRNRLKSPDQVYPGQLLVIPDISD